MCCGRGKLAVSYFHRQGVKTYANSYVFWSEKQLALEQNLANSTANECKVHRQRIGILFLIRNSHSQRV
jgi:hypothetical protein